MKKPDFDAARDAAVSCAWFVFHLIIRLIGEDFPSQPSRVEEFQATAAKLFGDMARVYGRLVETLSPELLDAIVQAGPAVEPVCIAGRKSATWHEAVLEHAHGLLLLPTLCHDVRDQRFAPLRRSIRQRDFSGLGPALATFDGDDPAGYWRRVVEALREFPVFDPEEITAQLELEWGRASSGTTDEIVNADSPSHSDAGQFTCNDRMLAQFTRDKRCIEWSAEVWRQRLGVKSRSTITSTKTWKVIQAERKRLRKEKEERRERL